MLGAGLLGLWFAVLSAWGATLTVPAGGDIAAAVGQLRSGDTLLLEPGTYADGWGSALPAGVTIRATQPRQAVIRSGNGVALELWSGQQDITFDGLVIDKFNQAVGQGICLRDGAKNITFQNGEIRNFLSTGNRSPSMGFCSSNYQPNFTIRNNFIHDIGTNDGDLPHTESASYSYGIYLAWDGSLVENNTFANISAYAIHGYPSPHNNTIRNNIFCNTGPVLVKGSGNTVEGNRLYHVGQTVYAWDRGQTLMVDAGNTERNNQVFAEVDGSICKGGVLTPIRQPLPAPWNLRAVLR